MTGRKANKAGVRRKGARAQQVTPAVQQQTSQPPAQSQQQTDDSQVGLPSNIKREQPPQQLVVKKILKAENDEARTLKTVFKSNPDSQMRDFIKKAGSKQNQPATKVLPKTPAENHPPAVAQELQDTDDDVADNLARLFKTSRNDS